MEKWMIEGLEQEDRNDILNKNRLRECLTYLEWLAKRSNLPFSKEKNIISRFFTNYINLYQTHPEEIKLYLSKKHFNEKSTLHEILYNFLENEDIQKLKRVPLIHEINQQGDIYIMNTTVGEIHVQQARKYFANTESSFIFQKDLADYCFERTCDFVEQNPQYQAIVKYLPNTFAGGHYHAYAKKGDMIVDSACNAVFFDGTGELIEQGETLYQTTAEELKKEKDKYGYSKLLVATLKHRK